MIQQVTDDIWRVEFPLTFMGLHLGARMTIIRDNDRLILHSPVQIPLPLQEELSKLGQVSHILGPNNMHHLFIEQTQKIYPDAKTYIARGIEKKNPKLEFSGYLPDTKVSEHLDQFFIEGCSTFDETVFYDKRSKTIICTDLIQHFDDCDHTMTRVYLKMAGIFKKPGLSRLLRPTFRNRTLARQSLQEIAKLECDKVIPAHGKVLVGENPFAASYSWLLDK